MSVVGEPRTIRLPTRVRPATLAWAHRAERDRVLALSRELGRQTMNLRTMPGARLVVLRCDDGGLAGWAGMDIAHDPSRPEVFSQFVDPAFRGRGFGALLEQVWWTWLARCGAALAYMRMDADGNATLLGKRLRMPGYRLASYDELGARFVEGCRRCELSGAACRSAAFIAVDVAQALADSLRRLPPLDLDALPLRVGERAPRRRAA